MDLGRNAEEKEGERENEIEKDDRIDKIKNLKYQLQNFSLVIIVFR